MATWGIAVATRSSSCGTKRSCPRSSCNQPPLFVSRLSTSAAGSRMSNQTAEAASNCVSTTTGSSNMSCVMWLLSCSKPSQSLQRGLRLRTCVTIMRVAIHDTWSRKLPNKTTRAKIALDLYGAQSMQTGLRSVTINHDAWHTRCASSVFFLSADLSSTMGCCYLNNKGQGRNQRELMTHAY